MKPRVKQAVLAAVLCALVVFGLPLLADSQARIVRLSYLDGSVQIDRNTGQGFERAITNMPITQGTRLATSEDGEAEVEFEDGSTVRLAPDTRIDFQRLSLASDGGKESTVAVEQGTTYFNFKHNDKDLFTVSFGGRELTLNKSAHFRVEIDQGAATLAVFNGELKMQGSEGNVNIKKNETLSFSFEDTDKYKLAKGVDQGQYDWWDKEREEYAQQYAYRNSSTSSTSAGLYPSNVPYSYGWSDLNYYGSYFDLPGYGMVWRPYSVGYGWDPFATGYWVWYPSFGYTWVSPYPWGWMPYRYGSWRFAGGYGWVWQPGYWNAWYPAPRVVNPPTTYRPPVPPSARPNPRGGIVAVGNPNAPNPFPRWTPRPGSTDNPAAGRPGLARPGRTPLPGASATTPGKMIPGTTTPGTATRATGDVGTTRTAPEATTNPRQPRLDNPRSDRPQTMPRMDTPRSAPRVDTPRAETPRQSSPRMETPRVETPRPTPRMESAPAPRMQSAPRMESAPAPRMESAPRVESAPRGGDGGGGRSAPAVRTPH